MPESNSNNIHWHPFNGRGDQITENNLKLPDPPPWRTFQPKSMPQSPNIEDEKDPWSCLLKLAQEKQKDIDRGEKFRLPEPPEADPGKTANEQSKDRDIRKSVQSVIAGVNAALCLRRPLLVTGKPGSGKTSLAYALAYQLKLGPVLKWPITARTSLLDGLYRYDAIARLQESRLQAKDENPEENQHPEENQNQEEDIGSYITLGSLGTAFLPSYLPRVLLIDEIDKSDINLPNDLLNLFEEGEYPIPELKRWLKKNPGKEVTVFTEDAGIEAKLTEGVVGCAAFPIVVMTSNGERDFPPAFKRRCIRITMPNPRQEGLKTIVESHFGEAKFQQANEKISVLVRDFVKKTENNEDLATDQLLNVIYMLTGGEDSVLSEEQLKELLFRSLSKPEGI